PRIMLVGLATGFRRATDPADMDLRALEYLWDVEPGSAHFLAHVRFFLEEVMPWAETKWNAPRRREQRATFGMSNSGGWAIDMALRNPEIIGNVVAFSPGGRHGRIVDGNRFSPRVRFYLQGGALESFFRNASAWSDTLRARGETTELHRVIAGHDWLVWSETLPDALRWVWGNPDSPRGAKP
ncbi:MAG: alpha/beta hydrolase-fold protein, partial [Gemmatimonadaceae bacterium]